MKFIDDQLVETWKDFRDLIEDGHFDSWAFRGQADAEWPLYSSISRHFINYKIHQDGWSQQEERILRIFKRKAHKFLPYIPDPLNSFEWLALMQHHGAPTRLIDFTWSPYVAAFFALERATVNAAVWAIYPPMVFDGSSRTIRADQKAAPDEIGPWIRGNYEEHFLPNKNSIIMIGEPHTMNQRLIAQAGTFAIPGVLDKPVEEILMGKTKDGSVMKKLVLNVHMRKTAMESLYRMNISNATLFPDLDGLAKSLAFELEYHWAFDPITGKNRPNFIVR